MRLARVTDLDDVDGGAGIGFFCLLEAFSLPAQVVERGIHGNGDSARAPPCPSPPNLALLPFQDKPGTERTLLVRSTAQHASAGDQCVVYRRGFGVFREEFGAHVEEVRWKWATTRGRVSPGELVGAPSPLPRLHEPHRFLPGCGELWNRAIATSARLWKGGWLAECCGDPAIVFLVRPAAVYY